MAEPFRQLSARLILAVVNAMVYGRHPRLLSRFYHRLDYLPNIAHPRRMTEKFLWRKLFDHNPLIAELSDKLGAKDHFAHTCPGLALPELLWIGKDPEGIPDELISDDVVIKVNFGAGLNIFPSEDPIGADRVRRRLRHWLRRQYPYGQADREWAYSQVDPKIFIERRVPDDVGSEPLAINIHCFAGEPLLAFIAINVRRGPRSVAFFDTKGDRLPGLPVRDPANHPFPGEFRPPKAFFEAIDHAAVIGRDLDYVRIDFMVGGGALYGGEMTFYPSAGYAVYDGPVVEPIFETQWDLRLSWFLKQRQSGMRRLYAWALKACLVGS